jgi:hypothetical protein
MKTIVTVVSFCLGTLLPNLPTQIHAAERETSPEPKISSSFPMGKKFDFKVTDVSVFRIKPNRERARIKRLHSGLPSFKEGGKIKFEIGSKGKLTGPGFAMDLRGEVYFENYYAAKMNQSNSLRRAFGIVYEDETGEPIGAALSFYKTEIKGLKATTYLVIYSLGEVPY